MKGRALFLAALTIALPALAQDVGTGFSIEFGSTSYLLQGPDSGLVIDPAGNVVEFGPAGTRADLADAAEFYGRIAAMASKGPQFQQDPATGMLVVPFSEWCASCATVPVTDPPDPPDELPWKPKLRCVRPPSCDWWPEQEICKCPPDDGSLALP